MLRLQFTHSLPSIWDFFEFMSIESLNGKVTKRIFFDRRFTIYKNLGELNNMGIDFIMLRRRNASLL